MNILIIHSKKEPLDNIQLELEKDKHMVYSTMSTLNAIDIIKEDSIDAIISSYDIQIMNGLDLPNLIIEEAKFLPPYILISDKLTEKLVSDHKNAPFISRFFKSSKKIKDIKFELTKKKGLLGMIKGLIRNFINN